MWRSIKLAQDPIADEKKEDDLQAKFDIVARHRKVIKGTLKRNKTKDYWDVLEEFDSFYFFKINCVHNKTYWHLFKNIPQMIGFGNFVCGRIVNIEIVYES